MTDGLDERLTEMPQVGPLLRRLRVVTYRDLLDVDPDAVFHMPGVGVGKVQALRSLVEEARTRAGGGGAPTDAAGIDEPGTGEGLDESLADPPYVGPLLRRLGVATYRDLLDVDLDDVCRMAGVGRRKLVTLRSLVEEARRRAIDGGGARTDADTAPPVAAPVAGREPGPHDDRAPLEVLGRLTRRQVLAITTSGAATVGELAAWLGDPLSRFVPRVGTVTIDGLLRLVGELDRSGPAGLVFGGPAPRSVAELADLYLSRITGREHAICTARLRDGATLAQIAAGYGITRERVRQLVDRELAADRPSWGPPAGELLAPAFQVLDARGGLAPNERVFEALGDPPRWAVDLALRLAGAELTIDVVPGLTTSNPPESISALRDPVEDEVFAHLEGSMAASGVRSILRDAGIDGPDEDLDLIAERWLPIRIDGETVVDEARPTQGLYRRVLLEAGEPLSALEVGQRAMLLDPHGRHLARNVVGCFARMSDVLSLEQGSWIHESALPVPRPFLDALARACLPWVESAGGAAVHARLLLEELRERGRDVRGVTPNLLRDALLQTGKVRGWRSGADIAWLDAAPHRKEIPEWIAEVAEQFEDLFTARELAEEISAQSGYSPGSVQTHVGSAGLLLACGHGVYCWPRRWFPTDAALQRAKKLVHARLPARQPCSASILADRVPELAPIVDRLGPGVLWGLGRTHPDIVTRLRGTILWRRDLGPTFWDVIGDDFLSRHPVSRLATFRDEMRPLIGDLPDAVLHHLLIEGVRSGHLERAGVGKYSDARLTAAERAALGSRNGTGGRRRRGG